MDNQQTSLIIEYSGWKRLLMFGAFVLCLLLLLPFIGITDWLTFEDSLLMDLVMLLFLGWGTVDSLHGFSSQNLRFLPDRIEHKTWFGETIIPTYALLIKSEINAQTKKITLTHGRNDNRRETIVIHGNLLTDEDWYDVYDYLRRNYHQSADKAQSAKRNWNIANDASNAFEKAINHFWTYNLFVIAISWVIYLILRTLTQSAEHPLWTNDPFALPQSYWHVIGLLLSIGIYLLVRKVSVFDKAHPDYPAAQIIGYSGLLSLFGILMYGEFGDRLDFYVFSLANYWMLADFSPRLSQFEAVTKYNEAQHQLVSQRSKRPRRSLQVSLALLGGLSALSNSHPLQPQPEQQCKDAQGQPIACNNSHTGGSSGGSSRSWHTVRRDGFGGSSWHFSSGS